MDGIQEKDQNSIIKKHENCNARPSCCFNKSPLNSSSLENINGDIGHDNNTLNLDGYATEVVTAGDVILINLEIGEKKLENVAINSQCLLQDLAEELAENETIQVVYFLNETIKKGGGKCDVMDSQVLVRIRPQWKWIPIEDLVDDLTQTVEEVFTVIPDYYQIVFSLAPRPQRAQSPPPEPPRCNSNEDNFVHMVTDLQSLFDKYPTADLLDDSDSSQDMKSNLLLSVRNLARLARKNVPAKSRAIQETTTRKTSARQDSLTYSQMRTNKSATKGMTADRTHKVASESVDDRSESVSSGPREIVVEATMKNPAFTPDDSLNFKQRVSSFEALGLRQDILKALDAMHAIKPTVIQMVAIPKILQRNHVLAAAQTGSGKTLAYLAPLVHHLRQEEETHGIVARLNRPRACIVVPARELAVQVLKVAKSISHFAKFRSIGIIGGRKQKFIREDLKNPVDLVVATPGTLLKYRQKDRLFFSDLTHLVIDEADTMFDSSFKKLSMELLHTIHVRESKPPPPHHLPIGTQVTIVGATLPDDFLVSTLAEIVPNLTKCTSGLHRVLPHVRHVFMKMNHKEKADRLIELLHKDARKGQRTIVFCNSASGCDWLGHYMGSRDLSFIRLHGNIPPEIRCQRFEDFQKRVADILICTDIASRGLDTSDVTHVINFDFPTSVIDYIHRVGRTGRVSHVVPQVTCRATSFVTHNREARMAKTIEIAAKKNASLDVGESRSRVDTARR